MPSPELSRLYEEGPLIEDGDRKEKQRPMMDNHHGAFCYYPSLCAVANMYS